MENKEIAEQLKQHTEDVRMEIKKSAKRVERNMLAYILTAAVLLYFLLK